MSRALRTSREKIKYSKLLSSLFCLISTVALSMLCLLNNFSMDIYNAVAIAKVVFPASFCLYYIGLMIGRIFDIYPNATPAKKMFKETKSKQAYEIPSMFSSNESLSDDEAEVL